MLSDAIVCAAFQEKVSFTFYLGTHQPYWLWTHPTISYFVSDTTLRRRKGLAPAGKNWALDSGGFTELNKFGRWTVPAHDYAHRITRYQSEIGNLDWAAPQDWMCEPTVRAKTGLSVAEHQERTIDSVCELRSLTGTNVAPVLQGWEPDEYRRHADRYAERGFSLEAEPIVGIGSVCRRQSVSSIQALIKDFSNAGIPLHAFGFKKTGLPQAWPHLRSADSMAWSMSARYEPPLRGCLGKAHKNCANCFDFAEQWLEKLKTETGFM